MIALCHCALGPWVSYCGFHPFRGSQAAKTLSGHDVGYWKDLEKHCQQMLQDVSHKASPIAGRGSPCRKVGSSPTSTTTPSPLLNLAGPGYSGLTGCRALVSDSDPRIVSSAFQDLDPWGCGGLQLVQHKWRLRPPGPRISQLPDALLCSSIIRPFKIVTEWGVNSPWDEQAGALNDRRSQWRTQH